MKRFVALAILLLFPALVLAQTAPTYSAGYLAYDKGHAAIQGFAPVPAKAQVPVTIDAAATSTLNVTGWVAVMFNPSGDVQIYMNSDTTKYVTYTGGERHIIIIGPGVTSINFKNAGASSVTLELWGM